LIFWLLQVVAVAHQDIQAVVEPAAYYKVQMFRLIHQI
jgi:hypothetical protein